MGHKLSKHTRKQKHTRKHRRITKKRNCTSLKKKQQKHGKMRGGNYQTDVTTRTLENMPMKPLNKVVTTVPGRGTMSASAYVQLMEDLDRNGDHYYD